MQALVPVIIIPVPHNQVPVTGMAGSYDFAGGIGVLPKTYCPPHPVMLTVLAHSVLLLIVPLYHMLFSSAPVYFAIFFFAHPSFILREQLFQLQDVIMATYDLLQLKLSTVISRHYGICYALKNQPQCLTSRFQTAYARAVHSRLLQRLHVRPPSSYLTG